MGQIIKMGLRVALLGIYHESNTFIGGRTTIADFRHGHWLWGEAIRSEYGAAHHEIGGMLEVMDREGITVVPVMFAEATPGGVVTGATYDELCSGMLAALKRAMPLDGCLVVPHGAGVSEHERDMDGHWLEAVRNALGAGIPMVGTLDLHANVSPRMVRNTDALVAYKENPHLDQRDRGREAASLLVRTMRGEVRPVQHLVQLPLIVGIEQQWTGESPAKDIYGFARQCERDGILSASVALGFPYADVAEMGTSVLVVSNGDAPQAAEVARRLATYITGLKAQFVGEKTDVAQAMQLLRDLPRPVLLLDMGDNIGGGTSGRGIALAKALEADGRFRYFSYQPDAAAVKQASGTKVGQAFVLRLSGFNTSATLVDRVDGKFSERNPQHGGQARFDMGETLICRTAGGGTLMVSTLRIPPFSAAQMTAFGLDPKSFDAIVAKGVNAPIAAYGPSCGSVLKVDTPGESRADITLMDYRYRRKPMFPFERTDGN